MDDSLPPPGEDDLRDWLVRQGLASSDAPVQHLVGDVSRRRYLRLAATRYGAAKILAIYPPDLLPAYRNFVRSGTLLRRHGVPTPAVMALDPQGRFMALQDGGDRALQHQAVGSFGADSGYREVVELIFRIQSIRSDTLAHWSPPLDRSLFEFEWAQTRRLFWRPALRHQRALLDRLEEALEAVLEGLAGEPLVVCHRDLMSRNVQLHQGGLLLLDHQDLRYGPAGYDLASLLHDSSRLSVRQREAIEQDVLVGGGPGDRSSSISERGYWLCVAQRMGKIVGTFCAFAQSGGRRHLPMIPSALESFALALQRTETWPEAAEQLLPPLLAYWSANLDDHGAGTRA